MVHRLLDVLVQDAWSSTVCVYCRRAKANSALHLPWWASSLYQNPLQTASMKITLTRLEAAASRSQASLR